MMLYAADNNQILPPGEVWCDALTSYVENRDAFVCPTGSNQTCGYAFSRQLGGVRLEAMTQPVNTVMIFESDAGWNAAGDQSIMPDTPRRFHNEGDGYGFADGHWSWHFRKPLGTDAKDGPLWEKGPRTNSLTWEPVLKESEGEQRPP